jgi:hypothetical protein
MSKRAMTTCKYYPIIDLDALDEKQITVKEVMIEAERRTKPFQVIYVRCEHNEVGIEIKYYSDEYGFITVVRECICSTCLKSD